MKYDQFGRVVASTKDICDLLYQNPMLDYSKLLVEDPRQYNEAVQKLHAGIPTLVPYASVAGIKSLEEFDQANQANWHMPEEYKNFDIALWLYAQCKTEEESDRVSHELVEYHNRNMIPLLQYLKYLVDTMRENTLVWGVGRGSSVASYILYLIGVHKINSIQYSLDIEEFLK